MSCLDCPGHFQVIAPTELQEWCNDYNGTGKMKQLTETWDFGKSESGYHPCEKGVKENE